jgi:hypothetical protein
LVNFFRLEHWRKDTRQLLPNYAVNRPMEAGNSGKFLRIKAGATNQNTINMSSCFMISTMFEDFT